MNEFAKGNTALYSLKGAPASVVVKNAAEIREETQRIREEGIKEGKSVSEIERERITDAPANDRENAPRGKGAVARLFART